MLGASEDSGQLYEPVPPRRAWRRAGIRLRDAATRLRDWKMPLLYTTAYGTDTRLRAFAWAAERRLHSLTGACRWPGRQGRPGWAGERRHVAWRRLARQRLRGRGGSTCARVGLFLRARCRTRRLPSFAIILQ